MITLEETKKKLRETFKVKRKKTFLENGVIFSEMISSHFINWFANQQNIKNVAFYYPINTEVDPFPIIHLLKKKSLKHCLPVICKLNAPLIFREWKKDTKLININSITKRPPGIGIYANHVIQLEKYFCCARYNPISFWAIVPTNTKTIIHAIVNTKNLGLLNIFRIFFS